MDGPRSVAGTATSTASDRETVQEFEELGIVAFTTTRTAGTFGSAGSEPVSEVLERWGSMRRALGDPAPRLATASQVHGADVVVHAGGWRGWLRGDAADGHLALERGTAMAVTVADCVPVFVAHIDGTCAVLHSGWRGTAANIVGKAIARICEERNAADLRVHTGPAICGRCYEVSPEVLRQVTGRSADRAGLLDLRDIIAQQATEEGVQHISRSPSCTRCDNDRFFSHRAGDSGRQIGVIYAPRA